jgi:hypothetical protein
MSRSHKNGSPVVRIILAGLGVVGGMILLFLFPSLRGSSGKKAGKQSGENGGGKNSAENGTDGSSGIRQED